MKPIVLVVTHKPEVMLDTPIAHPITVNHSINVPDYWLSDNAGVNISSKNPHFCELTAMYWAWKNLSAGYSHVGLFHYRRVLATKFHVQDLWTPKYYIQNSGQVELFFSDQSLQKLLLKYEVLLPKEERNSLSIAKHYRCRHIPEDWQVLMDVLAERHPEKIDSIQHYFDKTKKQFWANMFVMRRALFNEYCEWLFGILFEVEKRIKMSAYSYQARVFGFMAERLMNLYFSELQTGLKVKKLPCVMQEA
ncbi:MAG: DUF4422 domain-containing protein [Gammaproteobacteria bacterium]|nr:DUF4422 domain-containing protein [Gammaproteobacteria bacterium]MBD3821930.1 DUF4422 domain-containing protein [Thiotrichales bacterium]